MGMLRNRTLKDVSGGLRLKAGKFRLYATLFTSTLWISAFTFGGGYVILPLMRKKFVDQLHWMEEEEMLDLISIAQSSPGAMAVNISVLVGYRMAGVPGALVTIAGTVLPPLFTIMLISMWYDAFRSNRLISLILRGMRAGVAAVIVDVVITLLKTLGKDGKFLPYLVAAAAFAFSAWMHVNVVFIILLSGFAGIGAELVHRLKERAGK
jgi:chromate transporter